MSLLSNAKLEPRILNYLLTRWCKAIKQVPKALYFIRVGITNLPYISDRSLRHYELFRKMFSDLTVVSRLQKFTYDIAPSLLPYPSHTTVPRRVLLSLMRVSMAARLAAAVAVPVVAVAATTRSIIYRTQFFTVILSK